MYEYSYHFDRKGILICAVMHDALSNFTTFARQACEVLQLQPSNAF